MIPFARIYAALLAEHGAQEWWPGESRFEIMVGALLVQRTSWRNAEKAIAELKRRDLLDPHALTRTQVETIEASIRSAGFFRTKARRLRALACFVAAQGGLESLADETTASLRSRLLGVEGVGPETADAILLYAFDRPTAVIDTYLRRLAQRLLGHDRAPDDESLRRWILGEMSGTAELNELHALIVAHGKQVCLREPRCGRCVIRRLCRYGSTG